MVLHFAMELSHMKKLLSLAAGLTLFAGVASAGPVTLSEEAMDSVAAGTYYSYANGTAYAYALAQGGYYNYANAYVDTFAYTAPGIANAGAYSSSTAETD